MNASWRSPWLIEQEQYPCEGCGAQPGERCHTPRGRLAVFPHVSRFNAAKRAKGQHVYVKRDDRRYAP